MELLFRKAKQNEPEIIYELIKERVEWMNQKGIHQWNDTNYLNVYPLSYYQNHLPELYVLFDLETNKIVCGAILLTQDERWNTTEPSFYIHNFVSSIHSHKTGTIFIKELEEYAKQKGIQYLRLDSAIDNKELTTYYENLGFSPCGFCDDGNYHGILRQKQIKK